LHARRAEIDRCLGDATETMSGLARRFGLGRRALQRHRDRHLPATLAAVRDYRDVPDLFEGTVIQHYDRVLDALAAAEAAVLGHIDPARTAAAVSHERIAAMINDARAELGMLCEYVLGNAIEHDPELGARIGDVLERLQARDARQETSNEAATA
jgi:hypothetical protein